VPTIYPAALSEQLQVVLAGLVILANALVYSFVLWRRLRGTRGDSTA
jgi:hypothetical protein